MFAESTQKNVVTTWWHGDNGNMDFLEEVGAICLLVFASLFGVKNPSNFMMGLPLEYCDS